MCVCVAQRHANTLPRRECIKRCAHFAWMGYSFSCKCMMPDTHPYTHKRSGAGAHIHTNTRTNTHKRHRWKAKSSFTGARRATGWFSRNVWDVSCWYEASCGTYTQCTVTRCGKLANSHTHTHTYTHTTYSLKISHFLSIPCPQHLPHPSLLRYAA